MSDIDARTETTGTDPVKRPALKRRNLDPQMRKRRFKRVDMARLTRISFLPSVFTTLNLFLGYLALYQIITLKHYRTAILYITASVIMDGFDGTIARLTKTESNFGVQLDSLADAITFGLVPSVLIYFWGFHHTGYIKLGMVVAFIYLSAGVMRLARFNVYKEAGVVPSNIFIGLPIPTGALAISSVMLVLPGRQPQSDVQVAVFTVYCLLVSYLMISTVHYHTNKRLIFRNSLRTLFLIAIFVGCLIKFPDVTIPAGTLLYVLSPITYFIYRRLRRKAPPPPTDRPSPPHGPGAPGESAVRSDPQP